LLEVKSNVGVKIKGTSRTKKKEARPASPPVVPVKAAPTLRIPRYSVIFLLRPSGHFVGFYPVIYLDIVSVHHIVTIRVI
jgi:hypothetical protein